MTSDAKNSPTKNRSGSEKRQRGSSVGFRASNDELTAIKAAADRAGLTVSSYVRSRALEKPTTRAVRRPPVATAQLAQLLGLVGVAGGDLQRLARRSDTDPVTSAEIMLAVAEFRGVASAILQTLGKRAHDY